MEREIDLGGRVVGFGKRPYIIADIGANHNGDMGLCFRLIDAAADCKVDAVKFQSWSDRSLISREEYRRNTNYGDKKKHFGSLEEMVKRYQLTREQHEEIGSYCQSKGITFCSTPFSMAEANMLEELDVPFFKTASMDINHLPFLRHVARKQRPMVVSTGMATLGEIERALKEIKEAGNDRVILLHCVALYPPRFDVVNLRNILMLAKTFQVPVGFSDHTIGVGCSLASVGLGACVVEKHFTLDKDMEGWDHDISSDPIEMAEIVRESDSIWRALGSYSRVICEEEVKKSQSFRRSLVATRRIGAGEILLETDIDFKRPGTGIKPDEMEYVIGRKLVKDIDEDELLSWGHIIQEA
jgi:N,N'-diacetyllegionaminate synthase